MNLNGDLLELQNSWLARWPEALALWSRFTKLSEPRWCNTQEEEKTEMLSGSFAMIRLFDQAVVISLRQIAQRKLDGFALEILAHEIGHHILCPANLSDHARCIARMRRALPTREALAPMISNLYTDLLINDRLKREAGLRLAEVYQAINEGSPDQLWTLYMRIYEILWSLPKGTLAVGKIDATLEGDAGLGARLVRSYAGDWLRGAGRFAALCFPYLIDNDGTEGKKRIKIWLDTQNAGAGGFPDGLVAIDDEEESGAIHPSLDEELSGIPSTPNNEQEKEIAETPQNIGGGGQCREPFELGEILQGLGIELTPHEIAIRYYRERAVPHLVRFPARSVPQAQEPLVEALEEWDIGAPLEELDWFESALGAPRVVPGLNTVRRSYGLEIGTLPDVQPVDLDLYVDCSGSMPNPQVQNSPLALAGAIVALSALRTGSRVQATLWSGKQDFQTTGTFIQNEREILKILTGYIGGATAFPIHLLRETFKVRTKADRPVHILVISDDGVTTMFDSDEQGNSGWDIARMALGNARGGGTLVLNLYREIEVFLELMQARGEGWNMHRVQNWDDLLIFAREFSRANYGKQ